MKAKTQEQAKLTFAGYVVASMMARSGVNFRFSPNGRHRGAVEFIVLKDESTYQSIKVKYSDKTSQVKNIWQNWTHSKSRGHDQLIVVTGHGEQIFAEPSVAPMLAVEGDISVSLLN